MCPQVNRIQLQLMSNHFRGREWFWLLFPAWNHVFGVFINQLPALSPSLPWPFFTPTCWSEPWSALFMLLCTKLVHWCLFDQHCSTGFISGRVPKLKIDQQCCRIANVFSRVFFQSFVQNLPLKRWSVNRARTSRNRPGDTGSKEFFLLMIFTHLDKGQKFLSANEAFSANASAGDLFKGQFFWWSEAKSSD